MGKGGIVDGKGGLVAVGGGRRAGREGLGLDLRREGGWERAFLDGTARRSRDKCVGRGAERRGGHAHDLRVRERCASAGAAGCCCVGKPAYASQAVPPPAAAVGSSRSEPSTAAAAASTIKAALALSPAGTPAPPA